MEGAFKFALISTGRDIVINKDNHKDIFFKSDLPFIGWHGNEVTKMN